MTPLQIFNLGMGIAEIAWPAVESAFRNGEITAEEFAAAKVRKGASEGRYDGNMAKAESEIAEKQADEG